MSQFHKKYFLCFCDMCIQVYENVFFFSSSSSFLPAKLNNIHINYQWFFLVEKPHLPFFLQLLRSTRFAFILTVPKYLWRPGIFQEIPDISKCNVKTHFTFPSHFTLPETDCKWTLTHHVKRGSTLSLLGLHYLRTSLFIHLALLTWKWCYLFSKSCWIISFFHFKGPYLYFCLFQPIYCKHLCKSYKLDITADQRPK